MDFNADKPIFRQIVDLCHSFILAGDWQPGCKIPSVREMSIRLTVNTRTVVSAFDMLAAEGIIKPQRGIGYYLCDDAPELVREALRRNFFADTLPRVFSEMRQLGIDIASVDEEWEKSNNQDKNRLR